MIDRIVFAVGGVFMLVAGVVLIVLMAVTPGSQAATGLPAGSFLCLGVTCLWVAWTWPR